MATWEGKAILDELKEMNKNLEELLELVRLANSSVSIEDRPVTVVVNKIDGTDFYHG